jgi:hypothetical protein
VLKLATDLIQLFVLELLLDRSSPTLKRFVAKDFRGPFVTPSVTKTAPFPSLRVVVDALKKFMSVSRMSSSLLAVLQQAATTTVRVAPSPIPNF